MKASEPMYIHQIQPARIWYILFLSFVFDSYISKFPALAVFGTSPELNLIAVFFLFIALVLNSKEARTAAYSKIKNLQDKVRSNSTKYNLIIYAFLGVIFCLELFNLFGNLIVKNYIFLVIFTFILFISVYKLIQEHKKHEHLMRTNTSYAMYQQYLQKLIILLIPGILSRMAGLITAIQIYNTGLTTLLIFQYVLTMLIFIQSHPD